MSNYVLEIKNLTKYYGKFRAINDLNLKVNKGTVHGFLGPNGAGKTTTIRTILNILRASFGSIEIFGTPVNGDNVHLHERIGYVPGDVSLYGHMTVKQQLDYFASLRSNRPSHRMQEFIDRLQLDVTKHNRGLSKGNRQKVALVQAFMHDPDLYIFDEVTSGLDPLMQQVIYKIIEEEILRGKSFFISSHNLPEIQRLADVVSIIRKGEIVETMDVNQLGSKVVQKLYIEFQTEEVDYSDFNFPGVEVVEQNSQRLVLLVSESMPKLLGKISQYPISSITLPEPSLEDYFMHFYEGMET
ncbi:MAG: ATP-binding cassette domain-containing protein [Candidatus Hodarchaeales archaeon]|jgi:ABC-2 type transport system ATP-binding protein